ncbi:hypothetical protein PL8927_50159 [Planktothrix serta PCC 8927]|uniref:Uncharacterized protein n=1 Tax=Planktothrix serta PCC 8927 TaxID=671068 RepID=A0A7Z9DWY0_9CYAN|nr:hypothetical protein PL8927_50159 [Planktothrix serta PCC 8927]
MQGKWGLTQPTIDQRKNANTIKYYNLFRTAISEIKRCQGGYILDITDQISI